MNKKISLYILSLASLALAGCTDSLDQSALSELADGNLPLSDADAEALVNAVYAVNVGKSTAYMYMIDLTTETTVSGENPNGGGGMLGLLNWEGTNSYVSGMWSDTYRAVSRANDVIEKVQDNPKISADLAKRVIAEAKFLRAYYYNYAVQFWGPIPLVLSTSDGENVERKSITEVYTQIVKDLEEAAAVLPEKSQYASTQSGRATRGAALTLLSKVLLTWPQIDDELSDSQRKEFYTRSVEAADKVIASGEYALEEDFHQNWDNQNRNGKESIFATQHYIGSSLNDNTGGNHLVHCCFSTSFSVGAPHVAPGPDREVEDSYLAGDQRRGVSFADSLWQPSANAWFYFWYDADGDGSRESGLSRFSKYIDLDDPENSSSNRAMNRQILRYAEVLLIKAEAINERDHQPNTEAYKAINQVRRRAFSEEIGSTDVQPHDLQGLSYETFREAIQQERDWEFVNEQKHWLDLKRWGILVKHIKNSAVAQNYPEYNKQTIDFKHYRFPIPQAQREINPKLWQNYGYDGSTITSNPYVGRE